MSFIEEIKEKLRIDDYIGFRLFLISDRNIAVEGHKGIYEISDTIIRIKVNKGTVIITGHELMIKDISNTEIFISGYIKGIEL